MSILWPFVFAEREKSIICLYCVQQLLCTQAIIIKRCSQISIWPEMLQLMLYKPHWWRRLKKPSGACVSVPQEKFIPGWKCWDHTQPGWNSSPRRCLTPQNYPGDGSEESGTQNRELKHLHSPKMTAQRSTCLWDVQTAIWAVTKLMPGTGINNFHSLPQW